MSIPAALITKHHGETFFCRTLAADELAFCNRILSSEALAAIVLHLLSVKKGASVVRMADGEKALLDVVAGRPPRHFLVNKSWLAVYGVTTADLKKIGESLLWAGQNADYLATSISGLYRSSYNVHQFFPERSQFIDQFYHRIWSDIGRLRAILPAVPVVVVHREASKVAQRLCEKFGIDHMDAVPVNSWEDHPRVEAEVAKSKARLVLVSAGPTGKAMIVRMAQKRNDQVVLDVGGALTKVWCR